MSEKKEINVVNPSDMSFRQTLSRDCNRIKYEAYAEFIPWALNKVSTFAGVVLTNIGEHCKNEMTTKANRYRRQ